MFVATIVLSLAVLGPMGSHGLSTSKKEVVYQDDRPGEVRNCYSCCKLFNSFSLGVVVSFEKPGQDHEENS